MKERAPRRSADREIASPQVWAWGDDPAALEALWSSSGVVAIPTESTYGLAVDPSDSQAVEAVLRIKGRPGTQPLPVVAGAIEDLARLGARLDDPALAPVLAAWPAPLTVVVPLDRPLPAALGMSTLAVRIPSHPRLRGLLARLGRAVTATSANRSGEAPAVTVGEVSGLLTGERAAIVRQSRLPGGAPSTIVAVRDGELVVLREGRFPSSRLVAA